MAKFWIGTSGYNYKEWKGPFYPPEIAEPEMLKYYAQRFATVEINYTFYRMPNVRTLQGWAKETPDGFVFTLKAPRRITHDLRLRDAADPLTYFCDTAKALKTEARRHALPAAAVSEEGRGAARGLLAPAAAGISAGVRVSQSDVVRRRRVRMPAALRCRPVHRRA